MDSLDQLIELINEELEGLSSADPDRGGLFIALELIEKLQKEDSHG